MIAEILCVGTELLLGQVLDTNSAYLSRELSALGIDVFHHSTVGDNPARLREAILRALTRVDIVILSGGLGPTLDDITKETLAEVLGRPMLMHEESKAAIEAFFSGIGRTMTPNNLRQAMFPEDAQVLPNRHGTAPGCVVRQGEKMVIVLPGPPRELKGLFADHVAGLLAELSHDVISSRMLRIFGVGESAIEDKLHDLMEQSRQPTLAPYAGTGECVLRMTVKLPKGEDPQPLFADMEATIRGLFGDAVYGIDEETLPGVVADMLIKHGLTLAMAESCTGGRMADLLLKTPGMSAVFIEGHIVYANEAKTRALGVPAELIATHGAVSEEVARAMAQGVRRVSGAHYGLATTGIAGPGGGSEQKPVGTVYIGLAGPETTEVVHLQLGDRGRENVRFMAALNACNLLRKALLQTAHDAG